VPQRRCRRIPGVKSSSSGYECVSTHGPIAFVVHTQTLWWIGRCQTDEIIRLSIKNNLFPRFWEDFFPQIAGSINSNFMEKIFLHFEEANEVQWFSDISMY
jgi:hypothetical protein